MQKKSRQYGWVLYIFMILVLVPPMLAHGSNLVPNTIRVGLRSNYSNVSSVEIKNTQLHIGYEKNDRFIQLGTLKSNMGFVVKANTREYYTDNNIFYTYEEAQSALRGYKDNGGGGVVAYISPNEWRLYFSPNTNGMKLVAGSDSSIIVENGFGEVVLVCENKEEAMQFVGVDSNYQFNITQLTKGTYRGSFEFVRQGSLITAVNIVPYEEYLYGVVPAEMPASWNLEALKAQAVVARSMSMYQYNKYVKNGYNVCDTTFTQVYKGFGGENPRTNQAVDETRGQLAMYNGRVAETLYYSTSGGYTEDPQYVWGNPIAYLKSIPDPYETEPEMKPWTRTITLSDIDQCLIRQNINIGSARGIRVVSYTPAGRVNELQIMGTNGVHTLTREHIRTFFTYSKEGSLRSRMFTIVNADGLATGSTTAKGSTVVIEAGGRDIKAKDVRDIKVIDRTGRVTTVSGSIVVEGAKQVSTYGVDNNKSIVVPALQEKYGDIVISGRGYGHGVGMSQSGARGMAKAGYTYDQIIEYYYTGVSVQR